MAGQWLEFGVALLAVGLLILTVHLARFPDTPRLGSEAEASRVFRLMPGGFEPVDLSLDRNMTGAIAVDAQSRVALLLAAGAQFVPVLVDQFRKASCQNGTLMLVWGEVPRRKLELQIGADAASWAKRLVHSQAGGNEL